MFLGTFLSNIGSWMQQIVLYAYGYELTESPTFVGQLVFAQSGPLLLLGLVGGLVADVVDRRRLLLAVSVLQMALAVALAVVVRDEDPSRLALFLVALAAGMALAMFTPAYSALLPTLVRREDLAGAISLNSTQLNASRVIGPAIGGVAFATVGPSWVFAANAASYVFVIAAFLRLRVPAVPRVEAEPVLRRLLGGFHIARRDRIAGRALATVTLYSFFCIVFVGQMPVVAVENLGLDEDSAAYGVFYACFGLGAVLGSLANGTILVDVPKERVARAALVVYGAVVTLFALLRSPVPAFPVVIVVGATYFGMVTALNTVFQARLADHERGRAMALWMMGFVGTVSIANLVFGPVVEAIGMRPVMIAGGAISVALAWYADLREAPGEAPPSLRPLS